MPKKGSPECGSTPSVIIQDSGADISRPIVAVNGAQLTRDTIRDIVHSPRARENEAVEAIMASGKYIRGKIMPMRSQADGNRLDFSEFRYGITTIHFLYVDKDYPKPAFVDNFTRQLVPIPHPGATVLLRVQTVPAHGYSQIDELKRWDE